MSVTDSAIHVQRRDRSVEDGKDRDASNAAIGDDKDGLGHDHRVYADPKVDDE